MAHRSQALDELLDRAASQIQESRPAPALASAALARVRRQVADSAPEADSGPSEIRGCDDYQALIPAYLAGTLPEARRLLLEDHGRSCVPCRRALKTAKEGGPAAAPQRFAPAASSARVVRGPWGRWLALAATLVVAASAAYLALDGLTGGPAATVLRADGQLFRVDGTSVPLAAGETVAEGEVFRSGRDGGAVVRLEDGSLVEMKARTELSIDRGRRGTTLELARGAVIVEAAPQGSHHLFVRTDDCLVSVTGTIFSVNNGTKGSRVSVIEGEVKVAFGAEETTLRPGDQVAAGAALGAVPVPQEIAWSKDVDRYVEILREFRALERDIRETVPYPGARTASDLLPLVPEGTVAYIALPNLGDTIAESYRLIRERIDSNPALKEWWQSQGADQLEPEVDAIVGKLGEVGRFLGQEVVVAILLEQGAEGVEPAGPLVLADVVDETALRDFVLRQAAELGDATGGEHRPQVAFLEDPFAPAVGAPDDALWIWPHDGLVAASPRLDLVRRVAAFVLQGEANGFLATDFYARIAELYDDGVDLLVAADLETVVASTTGANGGHAEAREGFERLGFSEVRHLILEQKKQGELSHHRAALTFNGPRQGMASWLGEPAPMGALDFVSPDAKLVAAGIVKDPVAMFDDLQRFAGEGSHELQAGLARFEAEHGLSVRDDFAATLGGEIAFALDGPLLPTPSWKAIVEVYDPARLQWIVEQAVEEANVELAAEGKPALDLEAEVVSGRTFYTLEAPQLTVHYTFDAGYLLVAPSRALLDRAIRYRSGGLSITGAPRFVALLPDDGRANFSALLYQDVTEIAKAIAEKLGQGSLTPEQQQALDSMGASDRPTLGYAYGEENQILFAAVTQNDVLSSLLLRSLGLKDPAGIEQLLAQLFGRVG